LENENDEALKTYRLKGNQKVYDFLERAEYKLIFKPVVGEKLKSS